MFFREGSSDPMEAEFNREMNSGDYGRGVEEEFKQLCEKYGMPLEFQRNWTPLYESEFDGIKDALGQGRKAYIRMKSAYEAFMGIVMPRDYHVEVSDP